MLCIHCLLISLPNINLKVAKVAKKSVNADLRPTEITFSHLVIPFKAKNNVNVILNVFKRKKSEEISEKLLDRLPGQWCYTHYHDRQSKL